MMSHDDVVKVQTFLSLRGYEIDVDGIYGPRTKAAVRAWQKKNELVVDGVVGPDTWASMFPPVIQPPPVIPPPASRSNWAWAAIPVLAALAGLAYYYWGYTP